MTNPVELYVILIACETIPGARNACFSRSGCRLCLSASIVSGTCTLDCYQKPPVWKNKLAANPRRTAPEDILHYYIALSYAAQVNMRIWCALGGCRKLPAQKSHWTPSSGGALGAPLGDPGCLLGVSRGVPAPRKRHHNTLCCMHHFLTCESGVKKCLCGETQESCSTPDPGSHKPCYRITC